MKVSIIIPYCQRIRNIEYVLSALQNQSMPADDFEVVIGCLELSSELLELVKNTFSDLNIILVMSAETWNVSRARNIAIKEARGEILVFLDADILVPCDFLKLHYNIHQNVTKPVLVIGKMCDYDEGMDMDDQHLPPFQYYQDNFLGKCAEDVDIPQDIRWTIDIHIDWAMAWTANLSIAADMVKKHNLMFDENFKGWGVEDTDWAYRVACNNIAMHFADEIWTIHLPHFRNVEKNHTDLSINFKKMLYKWPTLEVEIITGIGDVEGNVKWPEVLSAISELTTDDYPRVCMVELTGKKDEKVLYLGGCCDKNDTFNRTDLPHELSGFEVNKIYPLLGLSLPYQSASVNQIYTSPAFKRINGSLKEMVVKEAERISISGIRI